VFESLLLRRCVLLAVDRARSPEAALLHTKKKSLSDKNTLFCEQQMQRTLRAKLLKTSSSADRDERDKAQLASESSGTSPAWRSSVACIRVLAWLETAEQLEHEGKAGGQSANLVRPGVKGSCEGVPDDSLASMPHFGIRG